MDSTIVSFHPRKQHNFEQAAVLAELYPGNFQHITSIYFAPAFIKVLKKISSRIGNQLGKRSHHKLPGKFVKKLYSTEFKRYRLEKKQGPAHLIDYMNLNEYWQKDVLTHYQPPSVCISYDGISHLIFREWKNKSKLILDLAIGIPQYRVKIEYGDKFQAEMLDNVDDVRKRLYKGYSEEVKLADIILCGSEFVKSTVVYFFPDCESKCRILPYGAELEKYSFPERIFNGQGNLKFAFVGRLSWRKGAHLLLEAWREFVETHPDTELHFFGTPDKEIVLENLPPKVILHGWIPSADLIGNLKDMDVFVFPTTFEGSSTAVFQAMALKLPVITTVNSGTVLVDGVSCEMVEVGSRDQLVLAMDKMVNNPAYRKQLAENAFEKSKQYSWNDYKDRLKPIMDELLNEAVVR